jgi:hypothetical protein
VGGGLTSVLAGSEDGVASALGLHDAKPIPNELAVV